MNEIRVNDSKVSEMKQQSLVNTGDISPEIACVNTQEERTVKEMTF